MSTRKAPSLGFICLCDLGFLKPYIPELWNGLILQARAPGLLRASGMFDPKEQCLNAVALPAAHMKPEPKHQLVPPNS